MDASLRIVRRLTMVGETVACAESLTAGLVAAALADVPGASAVLRGGVVAYAADLKVALLGVDPALLERLGTVDPAVAAAMAAGARTRLGATWGLATTGVAGPGPSEGKPAGTVDIAVAGPAGIRTERLTLHGPRPQVRAETVRRVLELAAEVVQAPADGEEGCAAPNLRDDQSGKRYGRSGRTPVEGDARTRPPHPRTPPPTAPPDAPSSTPSSKTSRTSRTTPRRTT